MNTFSLMLDRKFKLAQHDTTIKKEFTAGTLIYFGMAYILAVNPNILSAAGMDSTAVMLATCLASAVGTFCMGMMANLPFAMSAGMGLNAFFAYTVVIGMGYPWEKALLAVFVEGIIFVILSRCGLREAIFNAIPHNLKVAVSLGIGLFIAFIGFQNVHIAVADGATLVTIADFTANFHSAGITILLFLIGVVITGTLLAFKVPGAMLIGIFATWLVGIFCQMGGAYIPDFEAGYYSLYPQLSLPDFGALGLTFGKCFQAATDFHGWQDILQFIGVVISFLFVDFFDTMGTLTGGAIAGNMLDEEGRLPNAREALTADAIGTTVGAILGTSTITTFVESVLGIVAGGRTGLTAVVTGIWFLVSMLASSIFTSIPSFATAPALLIVGVMMFSNISKFEFDGIDDYLERIPVFLCVISMVVFYSISEGIAFGIVSYVILNLIGKAANTLFEALNYTLLDREDDFKLKPIKTGPVSVVMACVTIVFICKYIWL